jgi:hypothetical protein
MLEHRDLTERVIGLAIEVHRTVGPGLLESVYETGLCLEFERAGIPFRRQVSIPVVYKGTSVSVGFRADIVRASVALGGPPSPSVQNFARSPQSASAGGSATMTIQIRTKSASRQCCGPTGSSFDRRIPGRRGSTIFSTKGLS